MPALFTPAGLERCTQDTANAFTPSWVDRPLAPVLPLRKRLVAALREASDALPHRYRWQVARPLIRVVEEVAPTHPDLVMYQDELASSVIRPQGALFRATAAFQEVVSDVYDGFFSAAEREGIRLPDRQVLPPLVKWHGGEDEGPYTMEGDEEWEIDAGLVSLPVSHAISGIAGWTIIGHETLGHDLLDANLGLAEEIGDKIAVACKTLPSPLRRHWKKRLRETTSDIAGVLNMGPAAAVGLITYFRGINRAWFGDGRLQAQESEPDHHPLGILRGFAVAETVSLLQFDEAERWAQALRDLVREDVGGRPLRVPEGRFTADEAERSARVVAQTILLKGLETLNGHPLSEIQNWKNEDETITKGIQAYFAVESRLPGRLPKGSYAAHAVAAGMREVLQRRSAQSALATMIEMLYRMHQGNDLWS